MNTNYSFQDLASDLSNIRSEISGKCNNFNPAILDKLNSAQAWAEAGQHEQSLGSLYTAYEELAKNYLSAQVSSLSTGKYLMELINIIVTIKLLDLEYQSILQFGVNAASSDKQKDLKKYCQCMINVPERFYPEFQSVKIDFDAARKYLEQIIQAVP